MKEILKRLFGEKEQPQLEPLQPAKGSCCPDCQGIMFYRGPEGGGAVNVKCANPACGHKFWYCPPFEMTPIDNDDAFYYGGPVLLSTL